MAWLGMDEKEIISLDQASSTRYPSQEQPVKIVQTEKMFTSPPTQPEVFVDVGSKRLEPEQNIKTYKAETIAEQIDVVLQEKLIESGLSGKEIRITEDLQHSVIFQIGLKSYRSLDEIENLEAVQMIRAAVAEWEKRTANLHRR